MSSISFLTSPCIGLFFYGLRGFIASCLKTDIVIFETWNCPNSDAGYVRYFVLGYYLHNYASHWKGWILAALLVLPIGGAVVCKLSGLTVNFYDLFWYLSISIAAMCVALFVIIKEIDNCRIQNAVLKKIIADLSNCSFGIYLIHFFVVRDVLWRLNLNIIPNCGGVLETFVLGVVIS